MSKLIDSVLLVTTIKNRKKGKGRRNNHSSLPPVLLVGIFNPSAL